MNLTKIFGALVRARDLPRGTSSAWTIVKAGIGLLGIGLGAAATLLGLASVTRGWLSTFAVLFPLGIGLLVAGYDFGFRTAKR